jgi:signal transduction histidine kinase/CheY-like chemotaxis protein
MSQNLYSLQHIFAELGDIVHSKRFDQRLTQSTNDCDSDLILAINSLLAAAHDRETELQTRIQELKIAADDAQTANKLLRMVKDELKSRKIQLDEAISKSEAASTAKSQFLANMSHEIRTPMNGILGTAELISRTELNPRQQKYVNTIITSGRALLTIINDILDFSKVESGKFELDYKPFDLTICVNDVAALLRPSTARKQVELNVEIEPGLPRWYLGDVGRLRQILTNIVGNSVKFTDKGEIRIRLTSRTGGDGSRLLFEIIDTGIGIPESKIADVFEKFSQVDNTSARRYEGTGLGLAICKSLVEKMGGQVGLTSKLGVGSTFWFTLPLEPCTAVPVAANEAVSLDKLPVIVLKPEGGTDCPTSMALRHLGCSVEAAQSLGDLYQMVANHATSGPVVALFSLPACTDTTSRQVTELRTQLEADVPIVVYTSVGASGETKALIAAGAQAYLCGQLSVDQLRDALTDVMSNRATGTRQLVTRHSIVEQRALNQAPTTISGPICADVKPHSTSRRILLVEDSLTNQEVARDFLEGIGCLVDIANNGEEAIKAIAEVDYGMVLMDCQMPVMDGFEATRIIREREHREKSTPIPIVALTANAFSSDKEKCLAAGMNDFLSKPFMPDDFEKVVLTWLPVMSEHHNSSGPDPASVARH